VATYYSMTKAVSDRGAQNYQTFETDFAPARTQYWHGAIVNLTGRMSNGLMFQGGTSTGRGVRDTCELMAKLPELYLLVTTNQRLDSCAVTEPWMTTLRGLVSYTVPKIDVLVSANMRSVPGAVLGAGSTSASNGTSLNANIALPNTVVQQALGHLPGAGLANGTTTVNMMAPGQLYGQRVTQVDMRFAKVFKFGGRRADVGIDLYNLFNTSDPTG